MRVFAAIEFVYKQCIFVHITSLFRLLFISVEVNMIMDNFDMCLTILLLICDKIIIENYVCNPLTEHKQTISHGVWLTVYSTLSSWYRLYRLTTLLTYTIYKHRHTTQLCWSRESCLSAEICTVYCET